MTSRSINESHAALAIVRTMEVRREEYLDYMTFAENRRPLFTELFGPIVGLKQEWARQGATPRELDMSAYAYRRHMSGGVPVNTGWMGGAPEQIIEESDEHILGTDRYGRTVKLFKRSATLALPLDYPVATMDDWLRVKPHYEFSQARLGGAWEKAAREHLQAGRVVTVSIPGGFDEPRQLMGEEGLCVAFYDRPDLVHDILTTIGDTACKVLDRVSSVVQVDALSVHEDMAGKSGPLAGPRQIEEFIGPYYRRVWDMLQDRGARVFNQDSDGDMNAAIPAFIRAGVNVMHPLEPAANMDIVKTREQYGQRLAFEGGLDKHVLRRGKAAIVAELEYKIPPMVATGGCVLSLDHRIPNGSHLDAYRFYHQKAWEIMNREAAKL